MPDVLAVLVILQNTLRTVAIGNIDIPVGRNSDITGFKPLIRLIKNPIVCELSYRELHPPLQICLRDPSYFITDFAAIPVYPVCIHPITMTTISNNLSSSMSIPDTLSPVGYLFQSDLK